MQIIKLDATDSTNSFLKNLIMTDLKEDFTVVVARSQKKGRGQMGTNWESEAGKNLTFSVLKNFTAFKIEDQFAINIIVSLAIYDSLEALKIPNIKIKWPNDILSGTQKICGILPENIIKNDLLSTSVIGIGLNVNQINYEDLPKATSLKNITGTDYNIEVILSLILKEMKKGFRALEDNTMARLYREYEAKLFRKDKVSTFKRKNKKVFTGIIRGVKATGAIQIELEDHVFEEFAFKEIELLY